MSSTPSLPVRTRGRGVTTVLLGVLAVPIFFALMIAWHECGHTVAAWLMGDPTARFEMVDLAYPCVGCNLYDSAALAPIPNAFVNAAGVLSTQVLAWTAVVLLVRRRHRPLVTWLLGDVLLVTGLDLIWQCVQSFLAGPYDPVPLGTSITYVDGPAVVDLLHQAWGAPQLAIGAALLAVVALDFAAMLTVLAAGVHRRRAADRHSGMSLSRAADPVTADR